MLHKHNGIDLRLDHAADTLANVQFIWGRPAHLLTIVDDKPALMSFDGKEQTISTGGELDEAVRKIAEETR